MTQEQYRIPTVFKPKKKQKVEAPTEEQGGLEDVVQEDMHLDPVNNTQNGVGMREYIDATIKDIKSLEKLRKRKHKSSKYPQVTQQITDLSRRINTSLDYILDQVPLDLDRNQVYETPKQDEVDNLLRSRKEAWSEFWHGAAGVGFGALLGGFVGGLGYVGVKEIGDSQIIQYLAASVPVITGSIGMLLGRDGGRAMADHNSELEFPSSARRDKTKGLLNFMYEVYVKGGFESRVNARVREIRESGANENSAVISMAGRAGNYDNTSYERIMAARVANELGMTTTNRSARITYMHNLIQLNGLEKERGIPQTSINYQQLIAEGERMFDAAKDDRDYRSMRRLASAMKDLSDNYAKDERLSEEDQKSLRSASYDWGYQDSGIQGKCAKLESWQRKMNKAKKQERRDKFESKIETAYTSLEIPRYVPVGQ